MESLWHFGIVFLIVIIPGVHGGRHERRLLDDLLKSYNTLERPASNETDSVEVKLGISLQQIIDVDEKNQILTTNVWLNLEWTDHNLKWNESDYGDLKDVRIPAKYVWTPDILMYNSADELFLSVFPTNVVVYSNGLCNQIPPGIFMSTCKIDITWYPFDDQFCDMKFGSWTYDKSKIDLVMKDTGADISDYTSNGEWDLKAIPGKRSQVSYTCCPEIYVDVTFKIHIRRRTLYYFSNLIMPCVLISSMALLGFTLPPDSGEKLTLEITILLSLTVFMTLVAEQLPQVSEAIPLLATYFNCIMFMVASSVVLTVVVLNYHHRAPTTHTVWDWDKGDNSQNSTSPSSSREFKSSNFERNSRVSKHVEPIPNWVRKVLLTWLPKLLRMQLPKKTLVLNSKKKMNIEENSSKSLLANVLDIDDDFRQIRIPSNTPISGAQNSRIYSSRSIGRSYEEGNVPPQNYCFNNSKELQSILRELRFITSSIKADEANNDVVQEWKFAAMVVDRFCLITFSLYTIISTVVVLLTAPHILSFD